MEMVGSLEMQELAVEEYLPLKMDMLMTIWI